MQWGALFMFSMDLGSGRSGGHVVVALHGELDLADAPVVAAALGVVAAHEPRIIVDLAGLEFIDASGVAALSCGRQHARDAGGDLLLAAPRRQVRRVLAIIWATDGSPLHTSVTEAAASAGASAEASAGAARQAVVPIRRQPAKMRWQRMAMNAPAQRRRAVSGDWPTPDPWAPCWRPPAVGGMSA
jgi:anti-sigma B factor antagonist